MGIEDVGGRGEGVWIDVGGREEVVGIDVGTREEGVWIEDVGGIEEGVWIEDVGGRGEGVCANSVASVLVVSTERGNVSLSVTVSSNVVKSKSSERNCCMS